MPVLAQVLGLELVEHGLEQEQERRLLYSEIEGAQVQVKAQIKAQLGAQTLTTSASQPAAVSSPDAAPPAATAPTPGATREASPVRTRTRGNRRRCAL